MTIGRILRERTVGETRWLALDAQGQAAALYLERTGRRLMLGQRVAARVGRTEAGAGGTFLDIPGQAGAFLRTKSDMKVAPEGSAVTAEIIAEARGEKLARAVLVSADTTPGPSGAEAWRAALAGGETAPVEDVEAGAPVIAAAFADALTADVTLAGGGRLRIDRTRALTAADIDSAGRAAKGSAAARALSLNRAAAGALARQMLARGLGGLVVLDCVAPLTKETGAKVRETFLESWQVLTRRSARVLAPSPLGLMEISADWWITPLAERMLDERGAPTPETLALEGLRLLERAAQQDRMGRLALALPEAAHAWLAASGLDAEAALGAKYGARLKIGVHARPGPDVSPQA